jgi:nucleoside-diphosphate-sugar epimerase
VGTGGKNLLKLCNSLRFGNPLVNYLRASLFGRRAMHLVPVQDVAAALLHVVALPGPLGGAIFNISADDESGNEFAGVEAILREALGMPPRAVAPLPLPGWILSTLLRLRGYSDWNPARAYDSGKLQRSGFDRSVSVTAAVREFGRQYLARTGSEA